MEGIDEKKNNDSNLDSKEDLEITKKFLIEVIGESDTSSTVELSNYEQALDLFDQGSKEGKNIILYEIHKSKINESVVKKVPVLNSSIHAERIRAPQEESKKANPYKDATIRASFSKSSSPDKNENLTLKTMKNKIKILASVVARYLKRVLPGEPEANFLVSTSSSPDKKEKATFKTMKNKIIILASVVAVLVILMLSFEILAAGASGNMSGHIIAFDAIQNYDVKSTTNIDYT